MATSTFDRNVQIINYLCSIGAYVVNCCCEYPAPSTNGQNTTGDPPAAGSLFTALAALYPTVWTDTQVLADLLETGAARGRFNRLVDAGTTYWYINLFMLRNCPCNEQYLAACPAIKDCPRTQSTFPNY